jgi:hypothetical protein
MGTGTVRVSDSAGGYVDATVPISLTSGGFPDASTTGPTDPELIDTFHDRLRIYTPGVYEHFQAENVYITLDTPGPVTLRNFRVSRQDPTAWFAIATGGDNDPTSLIVEDGDICNVNGPSGTTAVSASNVTARRIHIWNMDDGFTGSHLDIEGCYIHDMVPYIAGHPDGIEVNAPGIIRIVGNTILMDVQTAAVHAGTSRGPIDDVLVQGNYLDGGSYTVYVDDQGYGTPTNVRILDNAFGRNYTYGLMSIDPGDTVVEGNYWADTEEPI